MEMNKKLYIDAIYQAVIDKADSLSPFETDDLVSQESDFIKKHLNEQNNSDFELDLLDLKWNNIRNAFQIGFNAALELMR